jgi:hypothetical protein
MTDEELEQYRDRSVALFAFGKTLPPGNERDLVCLAAGNLFGLASRLHALEKR